MEAVTIAATGGLGNQLFQYAAAVSVARPSGRDIRVCCRMYDRSLARQAFVAARKLLKGMWTDADGRFRLDSMARGPSLLAVQRLASQSERRDDLRNGLDRRSLKRVFRDPTAKIRGACVLRTPEEALEVASGRRCAAASDRPLIAGHMQDDRLVAPVLKAVRDSIALPIDTPYLRRWLPHASGEHCVGVHVRRGDYMKAAFRGAIPVLPASWYADAAALMSDRLGQLSFLVVTDDPAWAKARLKLPGRTDIASASHPASSTEDLALLRSCSHHIIANSTFGWWGARLARPGGTVIVPRTWFLAPAQSQFLLPGEWTQLENPVDDR